MLLVAATDLRPPRGLPARSPSAPRASLAVRAASFARRVGSKLGQAPQASRRPPIGRGACVLPGQAPPPPTGAAARPTSRSPPVPSGPSGALHTGGAWHVDVSCTPPPPTGAAARPRSCGSPMALHDRQHARLKPPSPLRARNERFRCSFRVQRCRWFQWLLFGGRALVLWVSKPCVGVHCTRVFRGNADGGGVLGCDSGAGSRRIPPRITSGPCREPASRMEAPRALSRFVRTPHRWLLPSLGTSLTPAEDSGRRRRARPPQPRRRSSGRRPWRPRAP